MDEGPHPEQAVALIEPPRRRRRTHCPRGHALDAANTYRRPDGGRECRICRREERRRRPHKRKPRGGPNGRPPHRATERALRGLLELAAGAGIPQDRIAAAMEISPTTLTKHYRNELDRAIRTINSAIANTYVAKCLGGDEINGETPDWRKADTAALLHYMRSRLGWTEATGPDNDNVGGFRMLPLGKDFKNI
jgi:hypothetical protein